MQADNPAGRDRKRPRIDRWHKCDVYRIRDSELSEEQEQIGRGAEFEN
jgi:hypothetical protein